jgi:hypothetical protein
VADANRREALNDVVDHPVLLGHVCNTTGG